MKLFAMGDISFGDQPLCFGFGTLSRGERDLFAGVSHLWSEGDIVFANLESVIDLDRAGGARGFEAQVNRGPSSAAGSLAAAGITVVSLSNNHMLDHGEAGIAATVGHLDGHGIDHVGSAFRRQRIVRRNGLDVGFLAWSLVPDGGPGRPPPGDHYNHARDGADIVSDVVSLRPRVDRLVVSLHWGNEFVALPSPAQTRLAHHLVDAGADVVIGHHPHVLQPVERYAGGLICYSLGNFVTDYWIKTCTLSAILKIDLAGDLDHETYPVRIDRNFRPGLTRDPAEIASVGAALAASARPYRDDYTRMVHRHRLRYRLSAVAHIGRNLARFLRPRSWPFWAWLAKRACFVATISLAERRDPEIVYRKDKS